MSSFSADSAAVVATATAPPDPPGAPIPPLLAASPRGNPNLHVAPTQPARGLEPRGGAPHRLPLPLARHAERALPPGQFPARRPQRRSPPFSTAPSPQRRSREQRPNRESPIQPYEPRRRFPPNWPGRTLRQKPHAEPATGHLSRWWHGRAFSRARWPGARQRVHHNRAAPRRWMYQQRHPWAFSLPLPCWTARNPRVQTATPAATQGRTA